MILSDEIGKAFDTYIYITNRNRCIFAAGKASFQENRCFRRAFEQPYQ